jgi:hypothetical protein
MAGCRPEYLPVVIAGVEAMCDEGFDLRVSATTNFPSPLFTVNSPRARASTSPALASSARAGAPTPPSGGPSG